jgi:hypothetical protein
METLDQIDIVKKKTARKNYVSLASWLEKMRLAFANAMLPSIFPTLETVGYTEARLLELRQKVVDLERYISEHQTAHASKRGETDQSKKDMKAINVVYSKHRAMAKLIFAENALASSVLKLNVAKRKDYSHWFQDVSNFYAQLALNTELASTAESISITQAVVETQRQQLDLLQEQKNKQRRAAAEAKQTLERRNKAFDQLYPLYSEYIKYAKILLPNNQSLEAIGIKVKSR